MLNAVGYRALPTNLAANHSVRMGASTSSSNNNLDPILKELRTELSTSFSSYYTGIGQGPIERQDKSQVWGIIVNHESEQDKDRLLADLQQKKLLQTVQSGLEYKGVPISFRVVGKVQFF